MSGMTFGVTITREGGDFVVSVRDLPEVTTSGATLDEALALAADAIDIIAAHRLERGEPLAASPIAPGEYRVPLSALPAIVALLHPPENGSAFGVSFPDLPGCVSSGLTRDETIVRGGQALRLHLAGMAEDDAETPALRSIDEILADADLVDEIAGATLLAMPLPRTAVGRSEGTP